MKVIMKDFDKGAKRKCNKCSTLFFDFNKFPTICPSCQQEVNNPITNISKRGRPPKATKATKVAKSKKPSEEIKIDDLPVDDINTDDDSPVEEIDDLPVEETPVDDINTDDDSPVEEIIKIDREKD